MQISNNMTTNEGYTSTTKKTTNENTTSSFSDAVEESNNSKEEIKKMLEDLLSLIRTGLTVSELETVQKMLREINEKRKSGDITEEELKEMMQELEKAVMSLKKRVTGEAILEASEKGTTKQSDEISKDIKGFEERLNNITKAINKLSQSNIEKLIPTTYNHDELKLLQELKVS